MSVSQYKNYDTELYIIACDTYSFNNLYCPNTFAHSTLHEWFGEYCARFTVLKPIQQKGHYN